MKLQNTLLMTLLSIALTACVSSNPEQPKSDAASSALPTTDSSSTGSSSADSSGGEASSAEGTESPTSPTSPEADTVEEAGPETPPPATEESTDPKEAEVEEADSEALPADEPSPVVGSDDPPEESASPTKIKGDATYVTAAPWSEDDADAPEETDGMDRTLESGKSLADDLKNIVILGQLKPDGSRRTATTFHLSGGTESTNEGFTDGTSTQNYRDTKYTFHQGSHSVYGHWVNENGAGSDAFYFYQGQPTDQMPTQGTAQYTGHALIAAVNDITTSTMNSTEHKGTANFAVDFGDSTITGTIQGTGTSNSNRSITVNARIDGNTFSETGTTTTSGGFFGPDAAELAGTARDDQDIASFGATKQASQ